MANASVFNQFLREPKSAMEYADEYGAADERRQVNAMNRLVMGEKVRGYEEQNRLRQLYQQNPNPTPTQLRQAGFRDEAAKAEGAALETQKTQSEIGLKGAQTSKAQVEADAKAADIAYEKTARHAQGIAGVTSPEALAAWVDQGIAEGVPGYTAETRQKALSTWNEVGGDPAKWQQTAGAKFIPVIEQFKQKADMEKAKLASDTQIRGQDVGAATQRRGQDVSAQTTMRGQNMTDARGKEANTIKASEVAAGGKPPPGFRWVDGGRLEAIPGGPGDKLPEKQQNQVVGTQNLSNAIKEYQAELKSFGPLGVVNPSARAAMGTKYNNMMLQAKEAYNLGVLNGPDLEILTSVVTDPVSLKGAITPKNALDKQASELDRIMQGISSVSSNRRPQDAKPDKAAGGAFSDAEKERRYQEWKAKQ